MTAKEYLSQARRLDQRIRCERMEAASLRELASGLGSPDFEEHYNPNRPTEAPFERTLCRIWDMEEKVNKKIDKLIKLKEQICAVIEKLENPDERMVLYHRYIHDWTWERIGQELHVDRTTVYRWHNAALNHVEVPEDAAEE